MKGRFWRKALAASLALMIVAGSVPACPNVDLFLGTSVTASAEEQGTQTVSFKTVGNITDIGYYVYVGDSTNYVQNPDSLFIEGGTKVKVNVAYNSGYTPTLTAKCTVSNSINVTSKDDPGNRIVTYEFKMPMTGNVNVQIQMNPIYSTLTVAGTENGTVAVRSPKADYPTGERVYLDITPDEGYTISTSEYSYYEGSSRVSKQIQNDESGYYIEMPQADTTVNVQFSEILNVYIDNYNNENNERGIVEVTSPLSMESIHENSYVYLKVTPADGYKFKGIDVVSFTGSVDLEKNGEQENEFYFMMPDSDVIVYSTFVPTKTVTLTKSENGTVELKNESVKVDSGDRVLLDVRPKVGYALSDLWGEADGKFHVCDIDEQGYYFFEMPEHDVVLHAEFVESRTVTVDLGKGHEKLAEKFGGISGYTVNGTEISYAVPKDKDTVGEVEEDFAYRAREIANGNVIDADGKKFMGQIRLQSDYQSEWLYSQELYSDLSAEGITFKAMWADPISELTITAPTGPDYKCGKELKTSFQASTTRYKPCEVKLSEGVSLTDDNNLIYTNWLMENNETVFQGGKSYNIYGYIQANFNTYLTDDLTIKVNGGELVSYDPEMSRFEISVPIEHDLDEDGVCTSCGKKVYSDGIGENLMGYSLSLEGDIGVNFYMELDDSVAANENAYMQFTLPNGDKPKVLVSEAAQKTVGGKTYYVFKCNVAAKDMASDITAQMIDGDKAGTKYTYSVKDYADYLLLHTDDDEAYEKAAPLVKAMLNYGAYSQSYFDEGTPFADSYKAAVDDVSVPVDFKYNDNAKLPEGVTFEGATLSLKSETTLSLYFKGLPENTTFTCNGKTVETSKSGNYVVARIRGLKASELENDFTVKFGESSVTYNAMTYCYNVLNGGSGDENLQNVCKALYKYAQAAKAYFGEGARNDEEPDW
ncbi:hypothetical protein [Ruminococcus sp.]|uniref:InlB B-repeat-containing protein n=1 Tax=Ruminococcus sp. TaxID=41978 RepID=UPI0025F2C313|nr:hypothetical protein [Ruminococcus sp.]MBQ8967735.1 hypothetical protein [Ruminococcus sp.]